MMLKCVGAASFQKCKVHPCSCYIVKYKTLQIIYYRPQRSSGKVIFSQACVILFTGGGPGSGGAYNFSGGGVSNFSGGTGWSPIFGGLQFFGGGGVPNFSGGGLQFFGERGVSNFSVGVSNFSGGVVSKFFFLFFFFNFFPHKFLMGCTPPPDSQCAGGAHPTGMHSCFHIFVSPCFLPSVQYQPVN